MRTSVLRQAGLCRAAFAARHIQISSKSSAALLSQITRVAAVQSLPSASPPRFYSAEATAQTDNAGSDGLITRFADLASLGVHENVVRAITRGMGYENMTEVQSMTISPALKGKDIVAQAKTGTGKTLGFLVPVVQKIIAQEPELAYAPNRFGGKRARSDDIRAIIISPTRELAEQIGEEARKLVRGTGLIVQTAVGGTQKREMLYRTRQQGCHILVGTPGRLNDLLSDSGSGIDAPRLSTLVLDEADRMLEVGFDEELRQILQFLPDRKVLPRQTLLYSATIPKDVVGLARTYIDKNNFEFVQTVKADEVLTHDRIPQYIVPVKGFENIYPALLELVLKGIKESQTNPDALPFKAIVFLPTTAEVIVANQIFRRLKYNFRDIPRTWDIHSKLTQNARTRSANDFKDARTGILFSSDVTARGMDFPNVSHVIQCHTPPNREQYIHRLGRTGRANKPGQGWLIIPDIELQVARNKLPGLPIKRNDELQCATVDAADTGAAKHPHFEHIADAVSKLPHEAFKECYQSYLGGALQGVDRQKLVYALNDLSKFGWGLDQPPAVKPGIAAHLGRVQGLRVESREDRHRMGGPGHRRDLPGRGRRQSDDPFDNVLDRAQSLDRRPSRREQASF
ncbi:CYT-19 DEAD-box protein precursor [Sordaria brevicollis]|uniref:ATP-dependent RNA helicase n=1 Tax=Sordaria brevicollis TaxID=83679 RepID=A0AAE0PHL2_SORBR|nr:CYT-19 DEAD-box protein precursor [Sordaria brevicollis]